MALDSYPRAGRTQFPPITFYIFFSLKRNLDCGSCVLPRGTWTEKCKVVRLGRRICWVRRLDFLLYYILIGFLCKRLLSDILAILDSMF